jgi:tRNA 2-thiouridine synthesizing protein A
MLGSWLSRWINGVDGEPHRELFPLEIRQVDIPGFGSLPVGVTVNCIGDGCPKPQILTLKAVNQVPPGIVVELLSDNATAVETIPAMMEAALGTHLLTIRSEGCWRVYVCKGVVEPPPRQ